jgi:acetophenone carboxylase
MNNSSMMVAIDAGGTMTDAIVSGGGRITTVKVESTPHDLTVSLMNCLAEAGTRLGYANTEEFLSDVSLIRWSSTVTSNALGELKGAKVGAIVAQGFEETLYGESRSPAIGTIVAAENIFGARAGVTAAEVLGSVKGMLRRGVRRICICLPGSFPHNTEERHLKSMIMQQYPDHFLGSVPVVLGSEIAQTPDDRTRAHHALINAYVHPPLAASLFKCEDRLREEAAWVGPLLIGHTDGGVARVGKTRAIDTIESGPFFGLFGAASVAARYDEKLVMCLDVGGTTAKVGIARDGEPVFWRTGDLFGIPTTEPIALLRSCSVGGGSVASWDDTSGRPRVGPQSEGVAPGPACYGLGGTNATVTDAFLTLGYLDPAGFHGGRRTLDAGLAATAIDRHIAHPSSMATVAGALAIRDTAVDIVADLVAETAARGGMSVADTVLFAIGGNGPLFAPFVAEKLGIPRVYVFFALGPVFSAFGCDTSDVTHSYRQGIDVRLDAADAGDVMAAATAALCGRARIDLEGEGFDPSAALFIPEFEVEGRDKVGVRVAPGAVDGGAVDLVERVVAELRKRNPGSVEASTLTVRLAALRAVYAPPRDPVRELSEETAAASDTDEDSRKIWLSADPLNAPVHDWTRLTTGQTISGPAMIGGGDTTCIVPTGWTLVVDRYGNGAMSN